MAPTPIEENPVPTGSIGTGTVFRVGTLSYTLPGLLFLMAWLLWGDFSINLMENVVPSVLPLKLRELQAPNWLIAFFLTAIPSILNATVCPIVSFWSDRHRGPLGRRIPFILYTIPFLCLSLILIGLVPSFVAFLHRSGISFDKNFLALVLIGIFTIAFQFFNMFVSSVYYYLFNDVVPHKFLGRFLAAFRCVAVLAGAAFYYVIFPKAETHFTEIFVGAAVLYGVVFTIMCLKVKEGKYPPPSAKGNDSKWESTKTFFKESYSHGFYWLFYLFAAFWATSTTINVFTIFFVRSVGISLEQFGSLSGTLGIVTAILLLPCGILADKFHPVRTALFALTVIPFLSALALIFLFYAVPPDKAFLVWFAISVVLLPFTALFAASELPVYMHILPKDRFGQFGASTALFRSLACLVGGVAGGAFIDWVKRFHSDPDVAYRYIPFWTVSFQALSALSFWGLYWQWKKRGGAVSYSPPSV